MLLPIWTDRQLKRTPVVNYALIAINVLVFLLTRNSLHDPGITGYMLSPLNPTLPQFITYQFLHASVTHLLGNMIFLYVFGNSVEDRLGRLAYLLFYLAGGVLAGIGHTLTSYNPVLGASGAIAAVTGAYLALFPKTNITIGLFFLVIIPLFEVSGLVLILFHVGQDFLFNLWGVGNTAYSAHLTGYLMGFLVGMGLLLGRLLPREPYDLLALIQQHRRRSQFKRMSRGGFRPWAGEASDAVAKPATPEQQRMMQHRASVTEALERQDLPTATERYLDLLGEDPGQVLPQQQQLDVANHLMSRGLYDEAATAYELFLTTYTKYPQREQVQLILGLIYARYLQQRDRAKALLQEARPRLQGEDHTLADKVLAGLG